MPGAYEVILSAEAEENIADAVAWIAEADPDAAERWYEGLIKAMAGQSTMPLRCPLAPESKLRMVEQKVRQLLYGRNFWKYRVLFVVDGRKVLIVHVRHGARLYLGQQENPDEENG